MSQQRKLLDCLGEAEGGVSMGRKVLIILSFVLAGCATARPPIDHTKSTAALGLYRDCMDDTAESYARVDASPAEIAEAVAGKCEYRLAAYQAATRDAINIAFEQGTYVWSELMRDAEYRPDEIRPKFIRRAIGRVLDARAVLSPAAQPPR